MNITTKTITDKTKYIMICISIGFSIGLCIFSCVCLATITGHSMESTFHDEDICLMSKLHTKDLDTYDVIIFRPMYTGNDKTFVKRIVATEGDTIEIKNNIIYVNSQPVDHSQFTKEATNIYEDMPLQTVPTDSYFVLGDNRGNSLDSRYSIIGFVHESQIHSKYLINLTESFGIRKSSLFILGSLFMMVGIIICIPDIKKSKNNEADTSKHIL